MRPRLAVPLLFLALLAPATVQAEPEASPETVEAQGVCLVLLGPAIDPPACRQVTHDFVTYVGGGPVAHDAVDLAFDGLEPAWDVARTAICVYETGDVIHCLVAPGA
jgi:hypothetical protein